MLGVDVMCRNVLLDLGFGQASWRGRKPPRRRAHGPRLGHRGTRADGVARLLRRISQRLAADQSHPGPARLFRRTHLRAHR
jgi:hypothetical protein